MNDVVKSRQNELVNEVFDIEQQISEHERKMVEMQEQIILLKRLKEQRMMEYQIMEQYDGRGIIQAHSGVRKSTSDRLKFEDILIMINEEYGRPMRIKEIIASVEGFGITWSSYHAAYSFISKSELIKSTGERGYYNILAKRGW